MAWRPFKRLFAAWAAAEETPEQLAIVQAQKLVPAQAQALIQSGMPIIWWGDIPPGVDIGGLYGEDIVVLFDVESRRAGYEAFGITLSELYPEPIMRSRFERDYFAGNVDWERQRRFWVGAAGVALGAWSVFTQPWYTTAILGSSVIAATSSVIRARERRGEASPLLGAFQAGYFIGALGGQITESFLVPGAPQPTTLLETGAYGGETHWWFGPGISP